MASSSSAMIIEPTINKVKEIKMSLPASFDGNRNEVLNFLQNCDLHLMVNRKMYPNDFERIAFVMSLMTKNDAATWKNQLVHEAVETAKANGKTDIDLGTYKAFREAVEKTFSPYDAPGEALERMKMM